MITLPEYKDRNIRLLLAEDDPTSQLATGSILKKSGYHLDIANNGEEALALLSENDYALVLMDCMMPLLNGYDAASVIRNQTSSIRNHDIPIIALTANAFQEDRQKCLAAGMNDYLVKPVDFSDLLEMLDKWISPCTVRKTAAVRDVVFPDCNMDVFDPADFVRRNLGEMEISRDVAVIFLRNAPEYIKAIRKALVECEAVALRDSSHKLKGAAANIGLPLLVEAARTAWEFSDFTSPDKVSGLVLLLEKRVAQAELAIRESLLSLNAIQE